MKKKLTKDYFLHHNLLEMGKSLIGKYLITCFVPKIWIEDRGIIVPDNEILTTPRIGGDYAQEYISIPWRFVWKPGGSS